MSCWDLPEVAEAQRQLAYGEIEAYGRGRAFTYFAMALRRIPDFQEMSLLDLGCGAGHYGEFLGRLWPDMAYTGIDASQAMIDKAQEACTNPKARFYCCDLEEARLGGFGIALHSQALELTPDPEYALTRLLTNGPPHVILHKIRFTKDWSVPSHHLLEDTYLGHNENIYLWNEAEIIEIVNRHRRIWEWIPWPGETIATGLVV